MTTTFDAAIAHCVNLLGDADSTGAICGQIAGALYGYGAIHPRFKSDLHKWDDGQIALRAALLEALPDHDMLCILTGSATSDLYDVAPEAVRAATRAGVNDVLQGLPQALPRQMQVGVVGAPLARLGGDGIRGVGRPHLK